MLTQGVGCRRLTSATTTPCVSIDPFRTCHSLHHAGLEAIVVVQLSSLPSPPVESLWNLLPPLGGSPPFGRAPPAAPYRCFASAGAPQPSGSGQAASIVTQGEFDSANELRYDASVSYPVPRLQSRRLPKFAVNCPRLLSQNRTPACSHNQPIC